MAAKRCSGCDLDWPDNPDYETCPSCRQATWRGSDVDPMPFRDAVQLRRRFEFEHYYEQRGARPLDPEHVDVVRLERVLRTADEIIALNSIPVDGEALPVEKLPPEHFGREAHVLRRTG
jgi:hypothetical protein